MPVVLAHRSLGSQLVVTQLSRWHREGYLLGIMDVMHNFGRDIKSTPHIHMLITCGGLDLTHSRWVKCDFIPAA